jgi:hypothetical protein
LLTGGLVLEPDGVDLCLKPPGFEMDLTVESDVRTLTLVWLGDLPIGEALRKRAIRLEGPRPLREGFPRWLALTPFAATPVHERSVCAHLPAVRRGLHGRVRDSGVRKAFATYDFGLLDFHRELHWVEGEYAPTERSGLDASGSSAAGPRALSRRRARP